MFDVEWNGENKSYSKFQEIVVKKRHRSSRHRFDRFSRENNFLTFSEAFEFSQFSRAKVLAFLLTTSLEQGSVKLEALYFKIRPTKSLCDFFFLQSYNNFKHRQFFIEYFREKTFVCFCTTNTIGASLSLTVYPIAMVNQRSKQANERECTRKRVSDCCLPAANMSQPRKTGQCDRVGQQQVAGLRRRNYNSFKSNHSFYNWFTDVIIVANQNENLRQATWKIPSRSCRSFPCLSASGSNNERPFLKDVYHSFALINFYREQCLASIFWYDSLLENLSCSIGNCEKQRDFSMHFALLSQFRTEIKNHLSTVFSPLFHTIDRLKIRLTTDLEFLRTGNLYNII